jgi:hypothetical protein
MLIAPARGFVFLAQTKTGSTAIESAFGPYAQIVQKNSPQLKHTRYARFERFLAPFLAASGWPRESYEVVCAFREPIDWLHSWWRYRSREAIADPSHRAHKNYTGNISFEEFARAYINGTHGFARVGRQAKMVRARPRQHGIDRIFRYERLDLLIEFLCEKVGEEVEVGRSNVSPEVPYELSEECERELREYLTDEYRIYELISRSNI